MKNLLKVIMPVLLAFLNYNSVSAQVMEKDALLLNLGVGFGTSALYTESNYVSTIPPISASLEYGIHEHISIGGYLGYHVAEHKWNHRNRDWRWRYSYTIVGARGSFHLANLLGWQQTDIYGGILAGYNIVSVREPAGWDNSYYNRQSSALLWGLHAGFKYMFKDNIGIFVEGGYGIANLNVGLALKL
jgi:hypothetical protein